MSNNFFERVYEVTRLIPKGRVSTYGAIARYIGTGRSARTVGWALSSCLGQQPWVPAHRVVNRNGQLTGKIHFPGLNTMRELLESEGLKIKNDTVVNFENLFWDPSIELMNEE